MSKRDKGSDEEQEKAWRKYQEALAAKKAIEKLERQMEEDRNNDRDDD